MQIAFSQSLCSLCTVQRRATSGQRLRTAAATAATIPTPIRTGPENPNLAATFKVNPAAKATAATAASYCQHLWIKIF